MASQLCVKYVAEGLLPAGVIVLLLVVVVVLVHILIPKRILVEVVLLRHITDQGTVHLIPLQQIQTDQDLVLLLTGQLQSEWGDISVSARLHQ